MDDSFLIDLPPMSQLDCSVLDALPSTMRNQILSSYGKSIKGDESAQIGKVVEREREELLNLLTTPSDAYMRQPDDVISSGPLPDHPIVTKHQAEAGNEREVDSPAILPEEVTSTPKNLMIIDDQEEFLKEFRKYLKEWLLSSRDGPLESDAMKFTDFFTSFAQSNLELTQIILRFFRRRVLQLESKGWCLYFNTLLVNIQEVVEQCSGGTLKIFELNT